MAPPPRRTVQIEAKVLGARGLVSSKGEEEPVTSSASLTLLNFDAVVSEPVAETAEPSYECSKITLIKGDDASCAQVLETPLAISIMEGDAVLGTASLSLEPLMLSSGIAEQWLPLVSPNDGEAAAGEVLVAVVAALPLMSEEEWEESMFVTLSVDSLHALPARWELGEVTSEESHIYTYTASCSFLEETFEYVGKLAPVVAPAPAEEPAEPAEPAEGEEAPPPAPAPAPAPEPADPQVVAEAAAPSIAFEGPVVKRFLGPEATRALRSQIKAGEGVLSLSIARKVKNPDATFDSNADKYAALCAPVPTGLVAVDATTAVERTTITPAPLPEEPAAPPEAAKGKGPEPTPVEEDEEGAPHPYAEAGTYLKVSLETTRPLEPKPLPPPPPLPAVGDIIPKRVLPQFAAKTAVEEFDAQVKSIVESMVVEWAALFPELDLSGPAADEAAKDDRRRALLYALNTSGKYWMFKEKLKRSVVRLTKDTMSRPTSEPLDSASMELFYNELYVTLTQRLHMALNETFFPPSEAPKAPSLPDQPEGAAESAVLGALAAEMESVFNFGQAATYHKERIATARHNATAWYEYALFLMRTNELDTAVECSRESIALTPTSGECLRAHGAILAARGDLEQAEVFLKAGLEQSPDSPDNMLVLAVLYDLMGRTKDFATCTKQARLTLGTADLKGAFLSLATKLLPINAQVLIEKALQLEEQLSGGATGALLLCRGEMLLRKTDSLAAAAETLEAGLELSRKSATGFMYLGMARLGLGEVVAAKAAFEKALDLSAQPYPLPALLLLGELCLSAGDNARAKEVYLYACRQAPSCTAWLGAGVAFLRLGESAQAEEALGEANVLNNRHPVVWGQLALLCLQKQRFEEAAQALGQAYKLDLAEPELLLSLGVALFDAGKWSDSEAAIRRSMMYNASAAALQALGSALMEQHRYEEALGAYKTAIGHPEAAADSISFCKRQASHLLHFHLNRPEEADAL